MKFSEINFKFNTHNQCFQRHYFVLIILFFIKNDLNMYNQF